jgi:hypothetical protein
MGYTRDVYTGTGKAIPAQTTKAHEGAHIVSFILNPSIRWKLVEP